MDFAVKVEKGNGFFWGRMSGKVCGRWRMKDRGLKCWWVESH